MIAYWIERDDNHQWNLTFIFGFKLNNIRYTFNLLQFIGGNLNVEATCSDIAQAKQHHIRVIYNNKFYSVYSNQVVNKSEQMKSQKNRLLFSISIYCLQAYQNVQTVFYVRTPWKSARNFRYDLCCEASIEVWRLKNDIFLFLYTLVNSTGFFICRTKSRL